MRAARYQARSGPVAPLVFGAVLLVVAGATLGTVHHASARRAEERMAVVAPRPLLVVELARNQGAHGPEDAELALWNASGVALGRDVERFVGASLAEIPARAYAAWVLPAQEGLSAEDFAALESYLALGGGVVLTGRTGRDAPGRGTLAKLFPGARFAEPGPGPTRLRVVGPGALVAGLAPGHELEVGAPGRALAASPSDALGWDGDTGGAGLLGLYRGAPVAWLGLAPSHIGDADAARRLAANALRFALREPVLDLRAWPEGRPCAVLVDAPGAASAKDEQDAKSCRLSASEADAGAASAELRKLARNGCRFAAVPAQGRALPELLDVGGAAFVAIPEGHARRSARGSALMRELLAGYEKAERLGGVYSLRADARWRAAKGRDRLYTRVGDELRARGAWFADAAELADWWSARAGVRAELEVVARDRVRVRFANPGSAEARGVTARVYLPDGAATAQLVAGPALRSAPLLRISADHTWIEVVERSLDPGAEVSYTIRF